MFITDYFSLFLLANFENDDKRRLSADVSIDFYTEFFLLIDPNGLIYFQTKYNDK